MICWIRSPVVLEASIHRNFLFKKKTELNALHKQALSPYEQRIRQLEDQIANERATFAKQLDVIGRKEHLLDQKNNEIY